jgi:hypothetical protein
MAVIDSGNDAAGKANVNTQHQLVVSGAGDTFDETTAGQFMVVDAKGEPMVFDYEGRVDTSRDSLTFYDPIDGASAVPDFRLWTWAGTTMTAVQNSGPSRYTLNGGAITTINTNITLSSLGTFAPFHEASIYLHARVRPVNLPNTNSQVEFGIGTASGAGAVSDTVSSRSTLPWW